MGRGMSAHHVHHNYTPEQQAALSKCYELDEHIEKIEKFLKIVAIACVVVFAPLILVLGIMYGVGNVDAWIVFLAGGVFLAVLITLLIFVIRARIKKHRIKKEIQRICSENGVSYFVD